ncbi:MAG: sigma-54 dependent transcriptional regulator [Verrucomicrobiota bacterium]
MEDDFDLKPSLLIVDDEKHTREGLRRALDGKFEVYLAADVDSALNILSAETIEVVLTDLKLGGAQSGMKLVQKCKAMSKAPICIMMTAYGSIENAVEAMRKGAHHYITKPINIDELEMVLLRSVKSRKVEVENSQLREELDRKFGLENVIGNAPSMVEIFEIVKQVADSRATILIEGESGTGKELIAHAIHSCSGRKKMPFLAIHCAALSANLLESELFGHEKGAFTGAMEKRLGRFEQANGGTLFLDEIGEIDMTTQVKLLRVLGERAFERVGGNKRIEVDVRVLAATNKNLEEMVREGAFREDLFYRLNVVRIEMPPLRERKEDIPLLTQAFLIESARENNRPVVRLSELAEQALLAYDWPGNVRELRTAIEHGVVLARSSEIMLKDLPVAIKSDDNSQMSGRQDTVNLQDVEKNMIVKALQESNGNRTEAAKLLGISRRTLHRKLHDYHLTSM